MKQKGNTNAPVLDRRPWVRAIVKAINKAKVSAHTLPQEMNNISHLDEKLRN